MGDAADDLENFEYRQLFGSVEERIKQAEMKSKKTIVKGGNSMTTFQWRVLLALVRYVLAKEEFITLSEDTKVNDFDILIQATSRSNDY